MGTLEELQKAYDRANVERVSTNHSLAQAQALVNARIRELESKLISGRSQELILSLRARALGNTHAHCVIKESKSPLLLGEVEVPKEVRVAWFAHHLKALSQDAFDELLDALARDLNLDSLFAKNPRALLLADAEILSFCNAEIRQWSDASQQLESLTAQSHKIRAGLDTAYEAVENAKASWRNKLQARMENLEQTKRITAPINELEGLWVEAGLDGQLGYFYEYASRYYDRWLIIMDFLTLTRFAEQRHINCKYCSTHARNGISAFRHLTERHLHWEWKTARKFVDKNDFRIRKLLKYEGEDVWIRLAIDDWSAERLLVECLQVEFKEWGAAPV